MSSTFILGEQWSGTLCIHRKLDELYRVMYRVMHVSHKPNTPGSCSITWSPLYCKSTKADTGIGPCRVV